MERTCYRIATWQQQGGQREGRFGAAAGNNSSADAVFGALFAMGIPHMLAANPIDTAPSVDPLAGYFWFFG